MRVGAVAIHDIQADDLVALLAVVEARVGDASAVRRDDRSAVRPIPIGQRAHLAALCRHRVDLGIQRLVVGVRVPVGGEDQVLAVRTPVQAAVVIDVAAGHLLRRAAVGRHHEQMRATVRQVTLAVESVHQPVDDLDIGPPVGTLGRRRQLGDRLFRRIVDEQRECDALAIRRELYFTRCVRQRGDPGGVAAVHPAHADLGRLVAGIVFVRDDIDQSRTVR